MKIFFEEFEIKNSEPDICQFLEGIINNDEIDKDDRCTLEIEIFFGKKYVTVKVYERILN
tara:strand:- start:1108 stop:1287 length:180 start_codon:yes stop_codon:yes gene_type:complete